MTRRYALAGCIAITFVARRPRRVGLRRVVLSRAQRDGRERLVDRPTDVGHVAGHVPAQRNRVLEVRVRDDRQKLREKPARVLVESGASREVRLGVGSIEKREQLWISKSERRLVFPKLAS